MPNSSEVLSLILEGDESIIRTQETALRRLIRENVEGGTILESTTQHTAGAKGDPITVGLIAMALIKSGAVVALINCLKAIIVREKKLKISIKSKSGQTIQVDAINIDSESLRQQLEALTNF